MHDLGDALVAAGFGDPVMDMQMLHVTYRDCADLLRDLRQGGHACAATGRARGLRTPRRWQADLARIEALRNDGVIPMSLELVFGHAWKLPAKVDDQGRSIIRFASRALG